jgi:hypothetical protein
MSLDDYLVDHASFMPVPGGLLIVLAAVWAMGSLRRREERQERPLGYVIGGPADPLARHRYGPQIGGADDGAIDPLADAYTVSRAAEVDD